VYAGSHKEPSNIFAIENDLTDSACDRVTSVHAGTSQVEVAQAAHDVRQFRTRWWTHRQWAKTFADDDYSFCGETALSDGVEQDRPPWLRGQQIAEEFSTENGVPSAKGID
jgi:hypothetical protein